MQFWQDHPIPINVEKQDYIISNYCKVSMHTSIKDDYLEVDRRWRIFGLYPHHTGLYFWRWSEIVLSHLHKHNVLVYDFTYEL